MAELKENELDTRRVAERLGVPEVKVQRWVHQGRIPCKFRHGLAVFKEREILDWARDHDFTLKLPESARPSTEPSLMDSIKRGKVHFGLKGDTVYSVLQNAVDRMEMFGEFDRKRILDELADREELASTGIGRGIAVPHPRRTFQLHLEEPRIPVFFLKKPVDFNAVDGRPVGILFFLFSPTIQVHLHLLSRLSFILRDRDTLERLKTCRTENEVIELIERCESGLKGT